MKPFLHVVGALVLFAVGAGFSGAMVALGMDPIASTAVLVLSALPMLAWVSGLRKGDDE